jgi:hypothetical protein
MVFATHEQSDFYDAFIADNSDFGGAAIFQLHAVGTKSRWSENRHDSTGRRTRRGFAEK